MMKEVISIPLVVRSTVNATGAITFTGNTLGLSRSETAGVPGTQDSIGAFTTTNTALTYGTYPAGTTSLYQSNSSAAILVLPAGSTVLYAELIWGGSYINGNVNLSAAINNPVTFITPAGTSSVTPDPATYNQFDLGNGASGYVRSANVTSLVQSGGAGTYITGAVVGTIVINNDATANHAGWTLGVIYQNPALPFRNMSLRAGGVLVQSTSAPVVTTLTGFATPISGTLGGRALFSAQEGDANRTGDQALFGPTSATSVALSGPNNLAANFFASQINGDTGALNTTGTFGTRNQINGAPGSNISGGRQGWDITNVDVSARLINNQSSAVLTLTTSGDAYIVNGNAIQVDINAPRITVSKGSTATGAVAGDSILYTVTVANAGTASAASVVLSDSLPAGLTFIPGSVTVAGVSRPTLDITAGVPLGSLNLSSSIVVTYRALIGQDASILQLVNSANAAFTFQSVAGGPTITGVIPSNNSTLPVYSPNLSIVKSGSTTNATVGDTVTYTLQVNNGGNVAANVTLTDNIPSGSSYVAGSFRLNGNVIAGANPATGVNLGSLAAGSANTVTFQVLVTSLPTPPTLVDQATASYSFNSPDGRTITGTIASNTLTIPVTLPNVTAVKSASVSDVAVGETFTYTVVTTNGGIQPINNVILTDSLPAGTSFVPGSVTVRGGAVASANPNSGISIGTLTAGSSATVTFQLTVQALPASGSLLNRASVSYSSGAFTGISNSNSITTPVYQPIIAINKSASQTNATLGDQLAYTLVVTNSGNIAAQVTVTDTIPTGLTFVPNSVTVNGTARPGTSPLTGITLGSLSPGATATVVFRATLNTLPSPPTLENQGTATYTYQLPSGRNLSGSSQSNIVRISASAPNISISKTVNIPDATVGDILTYTVIATNAGISAVQNLVISDTPSGSEFVPGSVTINGTAAGSASPVSGIAVGTLNSSSSVTVTYQARVTSVPSTGSVTNRAGAAFTSGSFNGVSTSITVSTPVFQPVIQVVKSASTTNLTVGDTFNYSIQINNTGNIAATVTLTDPVPAGAVFSTNSVIINGVPTPGVSPATGINLGSIAAGSSATVTFVATVTSLPESRQLTNQAVASFNYTLPSGRTIAGFSSSNTIAIPVSLPNVTIVNSDNVEYGVVGDVIRYTSVIRNNGTVAVNNVVYVNPLPPNTPFVPGSVIVNGTSFPLSNPTAGIPIGTLAPGAEVTVTFEVTITMPIPSQINNQSTVSFTSGSFSGSSSSNTTETPVIQPQIALVKTANTVNATVGDTVVYTVTVSNTGNLQANVTVTDTIPAATSFVANSVVVSGVPQPGATPGTGIPVGVVAAGATAVVTFAVVVDTLPSPQQLSNFATSSFTFTPPDGRTLTGTATSNTLTFPVSSPNVAVVKSTTSTAAAVGDTVTYSILVTNSGIAPVNNIQLSDPIPAGASFVTGSVTVNGVAQPAANPAGGISLGTLTPGASATITFSIRVDTIPPSGQLSNRSTVSFTSGAFSSTTFSNTVVTSVFQPILSAQKTASTQNATVGDTVSYTVTVSNTGNYGAQINLTDNIPAGTILVPNSVIVNGQPLPAANPATGISAGTVAAGATTTITFSVVVDTLPSPQQLVNQASVALSFTLPDGRTITGSVLSNVLTISVSAPDVDVVKSTTSTAVSVGDIVTYSVAVTNNGIATVNNVVFTDALPASTVLAPTGVFVDGVLRPGANPSTGITIGSIAPGATVTVVFSVRVTSLPASAVLNNQSTVSFTSGVFSATTFSNTVTTPVFQPILTAVKTGDQTIATVGDTVVYSIAISNAGNYGASVTLTDTIPAGTELVPNSVIINGASAPGADPASGIPLGVVSTTTMVMFSVVIVTLPLSQSITNQASATFTYTLPDGRTLGGSLTSNSLNIQVSAPDVSVTKTTAAVDAVVGDTIVYEMVVTNNGIDPINNVVLSDPIDPATTFVTGSVLVDGVPRASANPALGIALGTIAPGASVAVSYAVRVNSLPTPPVVSSQSSVSFTSGVFSGASYSNTVITPIYQPIIAVTKTANTSNATIGDTIVYSFSINNSGNLAANLTLTDNIPDGAVLLPNSVLIDGVPQPGANPEAGIVVGTIPPGGSVNVTVTLQVTVDTLPQNQQLVNQAVADYTFSPPDGRQLTGTVSSNVLVIPVSAPNVTVVKSTNAIDAVVGDVITYTVVVTNAGIEVVNNVVMVDPVPVGTVFVPGSVTVDGVPRPTGNPNTGITLGSIAAGASVTVTFRVEVVVI
ncbi:putative repeat protein (TIGR01451 family) [Paenibacillus sp. PvP094]